jgi:hypothetical protein
MTLYSGFIASEGGKRPRRTTGRGRRWSGSGPSGALVFTLSPRNHKLDHSARTRAIIILSHGDVHTEVRLAAGAKPIPSCVLSPNQAFDTAAVYPVGCRHVATG